MPSVKIIEKDYTQEPNPRDNITTLFVCGFADPNKTAVGDEFDENNVMVFEPVSDGETIFENKIGCISAITDGTIEEGQNATLTKFTPAGESAEANHGKVAIDTFLADYDDTNNISSFCTYTEITGVTSECVAGRLKFKDTEGVLGDANKWYRFTRVTLTGTTGFVENNDYVKVELTNEGYDKSVAGYASYGNQIAYEALRLGYRVIYKKFETAYDTADKAGSITKAVAEMADYDKFWKPFEDQALYNFHLVCSGVSKAASGVVRTIANNMDKLAETRGDCYALVDIDSTVYESTKTQAAYIEAVKNEVNTNYDNVGSYSALFANMCEFSGLKDSNYSNNTVLPASFYYLACFATSTEVQNFPAWFAIAGPTRGVALLNGITVVGTKGPRLGTASYKGSTGLQPTEQTRNGIKRAVNVISCERGIYTVYGNRTAKKLPEQWTTMQAQHYLNIRALNTVIKKVMYTSAKQLEFEPNDVKLWIDYKTLVEPTLAFAQANRGVEGYEFIKTKSTKRGTCTGKIKIVPIEAVEDFELELGLYNSLDGSSVTITE